MRRGNSSLMSYDLATNSVTPSPLMEKLKAEKKAANDFQVRRHEDWTDNYDLYRNKVKTNRLTQRQAVNIPLMKETVKTLLSEIDDAPNVEWTELSGDIEKELIYQEVWNDTRKENKLDLIDIIDKKNVLLYGISTKKLNIEEDGVNVSVLDIYDIAFDPLMKQWDLESARFIIHSNIFRPIREIPHQANQSQNVVFGVRVEVCFPPSMHALQEHVRPTPIDGWIFSPCWSAVKYKRTFAIQLH